MPLDGQVRPSEDLERHLQSSIPQVQRKFQARATELNLKYCEFDDSSPVEVVRNSVLPGGIQSFTATIKLNVSTFDGSQPNRGVEEIEDWFDNFLCAWLSLRNGLSSQSSLPELRRERELKQWNQVPTWTVQLRRQFDLRSP